MIVGILPEVVEVILSAGFVGQEEEGKALPADKRVASHRQLLVLGLLITNAHRSISIQRYRLIRGRDLRRFDVLKYLWPLSDAHLFVSWNLHPETACCSVSDVHKQTLQAAVIYHVPQRGLGSPGHLLQPHFSAFPIHSLQSHEELLR